MHDLCLILDYGSQYTLLIARRVRQLGIKSLIFSSSVSLTEIQRTDPKAIILSGGPCSVTDHEAPRLPNGLLDWTQTMRIPILGICYGAQLLVKSLGGTVTRAENGEYGSMKIHQEACLLYGRQEDASQQVWMSHDDEIVELPPGMSRVATSEKGAIAAIEAPDRHLYGVQYHPEVTQSVQGTELFKHFLIDIAIVEPDWHMQAVLQEKLGEIGRTVGPDEHAICALSGGVDSTVAATMVHKVLGDRLHCVFVDNGLLRENEADQVMNMFKHHLHLPVKLYDDSTRVLSLVRGVVDPEEKRRIIGKGFIDAFEDFAISIEESCGESPKYLVQGTLYPDVIESCPVGASGRYQGRMIKSHHNVGGLPKDLTFTLIEPLKDLFKDEVREIGRLPEVKLPDMFVSRHPFPGPGLAVRVLGDITVDGVLSTLRRVDKIYIESLHQWDLYHKIWQAFAVFLPVSSVGVQGDRRSYSNVVALRAVVSVDGMTADWFEFPSGFLKYVSTRICNGVPGINRVVYDITSKPPATIEWE